jgi:hypothetical protein
LIRVERLAFGNISAIVTSAHITPTASLRFMS